MLSIICSLSSYFVRFVFNSFVKTSQLVLVELIFLAVRILKEILNNLIDYEQDKYNLKVNSAKNDLKTEFKTQ